MLDLEEESVRLAVWIIDYDGPIENRCPEEHDDLRWVTRREAGGLELADAAYHALIERAVVDG